MIRLSALDPFRIGAQLPFAFFHIDRCKERRAAGDEINSNLAQTLRASIVNTAGRAAFQGRRFRYL
jgi:hypothetical protein